MKLIILFSSIVLFISTSLFAQQPGSPVLSEPPKLSIIVPTDVDFNWDADPNATSYTLQVCSDGLFQNMVVDITGIIDTQYHLTLGILSPNTLYYWRVRADNSYGSSISQVWSFITAGTNTQNITQLSGKVDFLVSNNILLVQQGIMLDNRLSTAIIQLGNEHPLLAIFQMLLFNARVLMLVNSNFLSGIDGQMLINYSFTIINLIYNGNAPILYPQVTDNRFELKQNYPNPFNPSTTIEYTIPQSGYVTLRVYDILGKEVKTLIDKYQNSGSYIAVWNASNNASGVYFYKLTAGKNVQTKRMLLNK